MKASVATLGVLLSLGCQLAGAIDGPDPPRTITRSAPGNHHTAASSVTPAGHSKNHVYGSPISTPIVHYRKLPTKKPRSGPASPARAKTASTNTASALAPRAGK